MGYNDIYAYTDIIMKQSIDIQLKQQFRLTPSMVQAIKLLQLSSWELDKEIEHTLEENPMLETDEYEWDLKPTGPQFNFEQINSKAESLQEHLLWQLNLTPLTDVDRVIGYAIIESLNEDGYLVCELNDIKSICGDITVEEIKVMLHLIQQFDPVGVACRNLIECLEIQINNLKIAPELINKCILLINTHLDAIVKRQYTDIENELDVDSHELQKMLHLISNLDPYPGRKFNTSSSEYIVPDVIVEQYNSKLSIKLNDNLSKTLHINAKYLNLVHNAECSDDAKYINQQLTEAKWFMHAIKIRNNSILKVANYIIKKQTEFFNYGPEYLQAMNMSDVAQFVGLHESTVSRIVSNKYIDTPRGILPFKFFLSNHLPNDNGIDFSTSAIKIKLKKIISNENPEHPFSDQQIVNLLAEQGIKIARRTVAKYRDILGIPSTFERKIY